jgi:hypothetical protein
MDQAMEIEVIAHRFGGELTDENQGLVAGPKAMLPLNPEHSRAALFRTLYGSFGTALECDFWVRSDKLMPVVHDYDLQHLTGEAGNVYDISPPSCSSATWRRVFPDGRRSRRFFGSRMSSEGPPACLDGLVGLYPPIPTPQKRAFFVRFGASNQD